MYRRILPQSDSDWGEFLYTFDLGLLSLAFDTQPLICSVEAGNEEDDEEWRSVLPPGGPYPGRV